MDDRDTPAYTMASHVCREYPYLILCNANLSSDIVRTVADMEEVMRK